VEQFFFSGFFGIALFLLFFALFALFLLFWLLFCSFCVFYSVCYYLMFFTIYSDLLQKIQKGYIFYFRIHFLLLFLLFFFSYFETPKLRALERAFMKNNYFLCNNGAIGEQGGAFWSNPITPSTL